MTTYAVTGATGHLGRIVLTQLIEAGVDPGSLVAIARTPEKAADLAGRGIDVRLGDYARPETLQAALVGVDTLLLVSGSEVGRRIAQHTAVIEAAKDAGIGRIVYTSVLRADTTELSLAPEHKATEAVLGESGLAYTILRNGWYIENYTEQLAGYIERGAILGAAGSGRISAATRADFAAAAVAALLGTGPVDVTTNTVYELGGTPFTMAELAATVSEVTGTEVGYRNLGTDEFATALQGAGLDAGTAGFVAGLDEAIARGDLDVPDSDLTALIGRPSTPLATAVAAQR